MPVPVLHVDDSEDLHATQSALHICWCWYFIPLTLDGSIQWLWVETHPHPAVTFLSYHQVVHPVGRSINTCDDALFLEVNKRLLQLIVSGIRYLPTVLDDWWNAAVSFNVILLRIFANAGEDVFIKLTQPSFRQHGGVLDDADGNSLHQVHCSACFAPQYRNTRRTCHIEVQ